MAARLVLKSSFVWQELPPVHVHVPTQVVHGYGKLAVHNTIRSVHWLPNNSISERTIECNGWSSIAEGWEN